MHFYGMGYGEVIGLPINVFWTLNSNIVRLMAEQDLRSLTVASTAQSSEGGIQVRDRLVVEMGEPIKLDPIKSAVRDEKGFEELRALM